jgi:cytochrome d ubiquinol oxidase subunit II
MNPIALQVAWFGIIAVMVVAYTVLDGYDLGIGVWFPLAKSEKVRNAMIASIGPFWDGNEVWIITAGASIFAAFPPVYATVFSGFYLALMLVLFALIFRAVGIDFWAHAETAQAKKGWGTAFALGSLLPSILYGVAFGNVLRGLPLNADGDFLGNFFTLLNPWSLLVGVLNLALLAGHGALWFALKTDGDLQDLGRRWAKIGLTALFPLVLLTVVTGPFAAPHLVQNYLRFPVLWALPLLTLGAIGAATVLNDRRKPLPAFIASAAAIAFVLLTAVTGLFPRMVPATNNAAYSLTAFNASSTPHTLSVMLVVAAIGLPLVAIYTVWVYRLFSGKVSPEGKYD